MNETKEMMKEDEKNFILYRNLEQKIKEATNGQYVDISFLAIANVVANIINDNKEEIELEDFVKVLKKCLKQAQEAEQ
jgi:hypothetical protein